MATLMYKIKILLIIFLLFSPCAFARDMPAVYIELDTTNFNKNLTPGTTNVQLLAEVVDKFEGGVSSVFGRTGAIVATSGDYEASEVTNAFDVTANTSDDLSEGLTNLFFTDAERSKLLTIEAGAEVNNISDINATDLTDGNDSTLHYHATDRARANHTGTQTASTIGDYADTLAGTTNTDAFTPSADYHVATKKYVDDNTGVIFDGDKGDITVSGSGGVWTVNNGAIAINEVSDVDTSGTVSNKVLKWNGTNWVPGTAGDTTEFTFLITSFSDGISATQEIGTGTWKAIAALSFSAAYQNGPATDGEVTIQSGVTDWASPLTLTNTYQGPTTNTEAVLHRSSVGTIVFSLASETATENDTSTESVTFHNRRHWGVTTKTDTYTSADIGGFTSDELSNARTKTFTTVPSSGEYIVYAYPDRLGAGTFYVGGFEGGFEAAETVSRTNDSGFVEDYCVYRSSNPNLGSTEVEVR